MDFIPPSPSLDSVPCPPLPIDDDIFIVSSPFPAADSFPCMFPPPAPLQPVGPTEIRGRSTGRSPRGSPSPSPSRSPSPIPIDNFDTCYFSVPPPRARYRRARSFSSSRSRSRSPFGRRSYAPSLRPSSPVIIPPPPPLPTFMAPPTPLPIPLSYQPYTPPPIPPSMRWSSLPVDILTFHYGDNMAYAPAAPTYETAIDTALELWPELHAFDRERISLLVKGPDQLVRVPKIAWNIVLCDLARYEVVRVQVDQLPPPPQYQGDEKGMDKVIDKPESAAEKKDEKNVKARRSGGLFSSIRRVFWR